VRQLVGRLGVAQGPEQVRPDGPAVAAQQLLPGRVQAERPGRIRDLPARYNIAPTQPVPAVRVGPEPANWPCSAGA
jgi:hypothetical protein